MTTSSIERASYAAIALLVAEEAGTLVAGGHRSLGNDIKIFGTDIDENAIAIARGGRYRQPVAWVSPERLERMFPPSFLDS